MRFTNYENEANQYMVDFKITMSLEDLMDRQNGNRRLSLSFPKRRLKIFLCHFG